MRLPCSKGVAAVASCDDHDAASPTQSLVKWASQRRGGRRKKRPRCTFTAGLERAPNQPCTSSYGGFLDGEESGRSGEESGMAPVEGRTCGKLAWLRPRRTTSIWERIARNEQEADSAVDLTWIEEVVHIPTARHGVSWTRARWRRAAGVAAAVEPPVGYDVAAQREMELWAVLELFYIFDVDGDGMLSKDEFAMYLRGIQLWGQHDVFTDDDWDRTLPAECQKLECPKGRSMVGLLKR